MPVQPLPTMTERTFLIRRQASRLIDRLVGRTGPGGVTEGEMREIKETLATLVGAVRSLSKGLDGYREREIERLNRDASWPDDDVAGLVAWAEAGRDVARAVGVLGTDLR